jgi:DNA polymerase III subunit epsilon
MLALSKRQTPALNYIPNVCEFFCLLANIKPKKFTCTNKYLGRPVETFVVIDFETTGLSPNEGARATEVGAVAIKGQKIVGQYQSLMNSNTHIPFNVTQLTGITNDMVKKAPPAKQVMEKLAEFIDTSTLIAHNANFDERFLAKEFELAGIRRSPKFICTMLLSRRIFQNMENYKLGTLVDSLRLPNTGALHRALADAETTAHLYFKICERISEKHGVISPSHDLLQRVQKAKHADVRRILDSCGKEQAEDTPTSRSKPNSQKKAIIECNSCGSSLRVPEGRIGKVRCPSCSNLISADTTSAISESINVKKVIIKCGSCGASLRVPKGAKGKIKCPSCSELFTAST